MELKPTKFDRSKLNHPSGVNRTDHFGQTYNPDKDSSKWSDQTPQESRKAHLRSDVDTSPRSLHHTLGPGHNQASPGDHIHDGITSKKIGPLRMSPTNLGATEPEWRIPVAYTLADVVGLMHKFINFRESNTP